MADDDRYVKRADFERAYRNLNVANLELRDIVLKLAAQVVTLTDELTRRLDHAAVPEQTVDAAVKSALGQTIARVRAADDGGSRVALDLGGDKYETASPDVPCAELLPLCQARCCKMVFALSTQDLDEGVVGFDYGQPYMIKQRSSDGYCVHSELETRGCTVHAVRPRTCREYDCRSDPRVWIDYAQRIPAPLDYEVPFERKFDLQERARLRGLAVWREQMAIDRTYPDGTPKPDRD